MPPFPPRVDGQAVVEGVMMRTLDAYAVAVRRPTGEVVVRRRGLPPRENRFWLGQLPLLRGLVDFFDHAYLSGLAWWFSLVQGSSAFLATADVGAGQLAPRRRTGASITCATMAAVLLILPLVFVLGPAALEAWCRPGWLQLAQAGCPQLASWGARLTAALVQLVFLPCCLAGAAWLPPLRRLCGYHGAEHKVRTAHARGLPLTLLSVRRLPAQTADCTMHAAWSFGALATLVYAGLPSALQAVPAPLALSEAGQLTLSWAGLGLRWVALVPVLALHGEFQRLLGRYRRTLGPSRHPWLRPWSPTVREPDAAMLEVALAALKALLDGSQIAQGEAVPALNWRQIQAVVPAGTPSARQARRTDAHAPSANGAGAGAGVNKRALRVDGLAPCVDGPVPRGRGPGKTCLEGAEELCCTN